MTTRDVLNFAQQLLQSGKADQAENVCRQVLAKLPDLPEAINLLGMCLGTRGKYEQAIPVFERLAALRPDVADSHANLGLSLQQSGQIELAEAACRRALGVNPNHFNALVTLGNVLQDKAVQRNDMAALDLAIGVFKQVIALRPDWEFGHFNLANALWKRGRAAEALAAYRTASAAAPGNATILVNLGMALQEMGEGRQAAAAYEEAMRVDPGEWRAMNNFGRLMEEMNQYDRAISTFRKAIKLQDGVAEIHKNLAHALELGGKIPEAIDEHLRIVAQWPADSEPFWNLCRLGIRDASDVGTWPYRGDRVVLLKCDAGARGGLGAMGLHFGWCVDEAGREDRWLAVQAKSRQAPDVLRRLLERWADNLRDEAAMCGKTAAVWMADMPAEMERMVRGIAGNSLVEASGNQENITARLRDLEIQPPATEGKFWAIVSIRNGGMELLPHWLEHYRRLGCQKLLVGVFDDLQPAAMAEIERSRRRWEFETFVQHWEGEGYGEQYAQRRAACRRSGARPGTWILNTDLDEFHQFPAPLEDVARAADAAGVKAIYGRFSDRAAADGGFGAVAAEPGVWEQFPIECDISGAICGATVQKVMMSRFSVLVNPCHHSAANAKPGAAPPGAPGEYKVAHFKWHGGLPARLRWGLEQPNASGVWKRETRRLLEWLDKNGGKIKVDDPVIAARRDP